MIKGVFIPGMEGQLNSCKSVNLIQDINKIREIVKTVSTDAEKVCHKVQHPFKIKTLNRAGTERRHLSIIKAMYDKPTVDILNDKMLKAFSLRKTRKRCSLLPLLFSSTGNPSQGNYARKINNRHPNRKGRNQIVTICRRHDFIDRKPYRL